jgi:hypothetical protein
MSHYHATFTSNSALSEFNCVVRRWKSESDLNHARLSPAIEVATAQTVITYSEGVGEPFLPGRVNQSTQTVWETQRQDDNTTEHLIPTTTTRTIETQTAIPERSSREVQTDADRQKTKVDQGTETDSIPTATSVPRGIQVDIQTATIEQETQTAMPAKLSDRHVQTDIRMTIEQETQTEIVMHARPSDQAIQTDFDIGETKVEQGIQTESIRTQTFPRGMQTVDIPKATAGKETQTALPAKLFNRYVQTASMQKATVEQETQTESAKPARLSDQMVQTDIPGTKVDQGIQTLFPTRNIVSILKAIQTFPNTAEQETQTELRTDNAEVTRQPGADNADPVDREVEKISQLELHPQFDFERRSCFLRNCHGDCHCLYYLLRV